MKTNKIPLSRASILYLPMYFKNLLTDSVLIRYKLKITFMIQIPYFIFIN